MDRFRPRPTPDELRGCHDNDADRPSPASQAPSSWPATQPPTKPPPANVHAAEQHSLPEQHIAPSIPR
jgi:hypothetical protein